MLDLLIVNGTVVDGTGAAPRVTNVGIRDGRIVHLGDDEPEATERIDATGRYVTPGFVDLHTHYDAQVMWDPKLDPQVRHGFTTIVLGNCGFSLSPVTPESAQYLVPMLSKVEAIPLETLETGVDIGWSSTAEMLDHVEKRRVVPNIAFGAGHSAIRSYVMGEKRALTEKATPEEIAEMQALLRESLEGGAISFSSSHAPTHRDHRGDPAPSLVSDREELLALASQVKDYEGTHVGFVTTPVMTDEAKALITDVSLTAQRTVNWPLFVPGQLPEEMAESQLRTADFARERGAEVRVQCSSEPQDARINFNSGFAYDSFPGIFQELYHMPIPERMERMREPETRKAMQAALDEVKSTPNPLAIFAELEKFTLDASSHPDNVGFLGRNVGEIAAETGSTALDVCLDIALRDDLTATFIAANFPPHTREGWALIAKCIDDDRTIWAGTDGGAHLDILCQYSHATTFLSRAVREHGLMSIERAIHEFTQVPAEYIGVRDRGVLREGAHADILVIDLDRLETLPLEVRTDLPADGMRLFADAQGYDYVIVNGVPVVAHDAYTEAQPGTVLRRGRDTYTAKIPGAS